MTNINVEEKSTLSRVTKIIFIGGAILLFILLIIWVIRWIPKAINGVSNIGDSFTNSIRGGEQIEASLNKSEINSGEQFVVTWEHTPSKPGEYYFSYSCEDSLIFDIISVNGEKRVICNTPFKLGENISGISLVPTLTKKNIFADANIEITYKDFENKEEVAFGEIVATIKNIEGESTSSNPYDANLAGSTVTSTPAEETPTGDTTTSTGSNNSNQGTNYNSVSPTYYGQADLRIENILAIGDSAFSFTVYNRGTNYSGNWYFTYTDAENPNNVQISPIQRSLGPNQGLFTTVRFDGQRYSPQTVSVKLDPYNSVIESNEFNNSSSVTIYGNTNYYNDDWYYYDDDDYYYGGNDDADLVIEDMEVGRISGNRFYEDDEIDEDDEAGVRFTVRNRGDESTGSWRFEITNTPYDDDDDYRSGRIESLRPGEERTFTIEFDNIDEGNYNIRIEVDSDDDVDEENENNNTETERLRVTD